MIIERYMRRNIFDSLRLSFIIYPLSFVLLFAGAMSIDAKKKRSTRKRPARTAKAPRTRGSTSYMPTCCISTSTGIPMPRYSTARCISPMQEPDYIATVPISMRQAIRSRLSDM